MKKTQKCEIKVPGFKSLLHETNYVLEHQMSSITQNLKKKKNTFCVEFRDRNLFIRNLL